MLHFSFKKDLLFCGTSVLTFLCGCHQGPPSALEDLNITKPLNPSGLSLDLHSDQLTTVSLGHKIVLSAGLDRSVRAWDAKSGKPLWSINNLDQPATALDIDSAGQNAIIGTADGQVSLWNLETKTKDLHLPGLDRGITAVAMSPDGQMAAAGDFSGSLNVWDSKSGQMIFRSQIHSGALNELSFSPDNRYLATASDDYSAAVWLVKPQPSSSPLWVLQGHKGWVTSLTFSPQTQWVATASADHYIRIWSLKNGKLLRKFYGLKATVTKISAMDEHRLALVGGKPPPTVLGPDQLDYSVTLFNIRTGSPEFLSIGHTGAVVDIKTDPSGGLVTASLDETIKSWDTQTKPVSIQQ